MRTSKLEKTAVTRQRTFWKERLIELTSLQAVLRSHRPLPKEFSTLMRCRTEENNHTAVCENCGFVHVFDYHCNKRFCPACAWQLSCERRTILDNCKHILRDPRHVVLTARNEESLAPMLVRVMTGVRKLRRREIFAEVRGGWCSFEVTNESRGWHVHAHLLVDAPFIPADVLAQEWAACIGQSFAIVKVKRAKDYLAEVTKYSVKPSSFISWTQQQRNEFVKSIRGRRFFFAFGHVAEASRNVKATLRASRGLHNACCSNVQTTPLSKLTDPRNLHRVKPAKR